MMQEAVLYTYTHTHVCAFIYNYNTKLGNLVYINSFVKET